MADKNSGDVLIFRQIAAPAEYICLYLLMLLA